MKINKFYSSKFLLPLFVLIIFILPPITAKGIIWGEETEEVTRGVILATAEPSTERMLNFY
jgi:hypothetical protein